MLSGQFEIVCASDEEGVTGIAQQRVSAPFHLSKPYWDGRVLLVQCVNATPGIFAGDTLALSVDVQSSASVLLTSPSASRIHTMKSGLATLEQKFVVGENAWLEVMPELFIPQAGCRYRQATRIDVARSGRLFFVETLAPGRVARGEAFDFDDIRWETDVRVGGELVLRERYPLTPRDESLWSVRKKYEAAYLATCCIVAPLASLDLAATDGVLAGASHIDERMWVVRMLAKDSPSLRQALKELRHKVSAVLPELAADARKL